MKTTVFICLSKWLKKKKNPIRNDLINMKEHWLTPTWNIHQIPLAFHSQKEANIGIFSSQKFYLSLDVKSLRDAR